MIRSLYQTPDGNVLPRLPPSEYLSALKQEGGLLWIDIQEEPPENCRSLLQEVFGFHPLAVEDALEQTHVPKIDDWGEYLYLVLRAVVSAKETSAELDTHELDIFLGGNYLVTYQEVPIAALERVWKACLRDDRPMRRGPTHLLYRIADELVSDYMSVIEHIEEGFDLLEDRIFTGPQPALLESIFTLKRSLLHLRRIISPQRDVLNRLARGDYPVIDPESRLYFRDVYDHLIRLHDIVENLRDLAVSALDTYLSVVNNRMNDVMKILTLITTLFMPISFLAGFFGMNFFQPAEEMGHWVSQPIFLAILGLMVVLPSGMFLWMRRRAWM